MASLELCSQYDYAKKALALYRKNEKSQNPFLLSLGVNAIEMLLKSIIEQESGIVPEELDTHYLLEICTEINKMRIPHFQINYKFQQMCKEIQRYYNGARYYNLILSILVDTFISKISFPMQPGPEIGSISDA